MVIFLEDMFMKYGIQTVGKKMKKSFLFLLYSNNGKQYPQKILPKNYNCSLYCYSLFGPIFGTGYNICISNNCLSNNNSYTNPHSDYAQCNDVRIFTNEENFTVSDYEVFNIQF